MNRAYLFFLLFFTFPVFSHVIEDPCERIEASPQVAKCARYKKEQSDLRLNVSYRETLGRIKYQYANAPSLAEQYIFLLRRAQREWVELRDADCKLEAFQIEESAEAYQVTIDNCISRLSDDRASYLNRVAVDI